MLTPSSPLSSRSSAWLGPIVVIALFGLPLFVGLGNWQYRNDEAGHAFSVDRILETGEWLTPRSSPTDYPFLEKPPLKFWMVAALIETGLVQNDEFGQRALDAVFGVMAFVYVFLLGRWMAGSVCGFAAVLVLFTLDPFVFEHAIRGNNMEAPLILAYCGGIYHFARWVEGESRKRRGVDAVLVAVYFALGFMVKFVAAAFLPIVCVVALALRRDAWTRVRSGWTEWIVPTLVAIAIIAPWFVYETMQFGADFWREIFGAHVYRRFTDSLDPTHLQPWPYYFTQTWRELTYSRSLVPGMAGVVALVWQAWQGKTWLPRLMLAWFIVPMVLISFGTSKLFHYTYGFLPPIALGAGLVAALLLRGVQGPIGTAFSNWLGRFAPAGGGSASRGARVGRVAFTVFGLAALVVSAWTWIIEAPVVWTVGGVQLFKNSSVLRPILIAIVLLRLAGLAMFSVTILALVVLGLVFPVPVYFTKIGKMQTIDLPLKAARDCGLSVQASGRAKKDGGLFNAAPNSLNHSYFYYLRRFGPWTDATTAPADEMSRRLFERASQTPIIMTKRGYDAWHAATRLDPRDPVNPIAVAVDDSIVLVLPGPYRRCARPIIRNNGRELIDEPKSKPETSQ